jgi:8-oxo-dGTP pyrophosphatase MutT (NUDIX family)
MARRPMALAAVLVPLIDHPTGLTVLLTERSADLPDHPGQISFPGGRIEASDEDAVAAALREATEEIGVPAASVEVIGYLPAHMTLTGFAVTPVVAIVTPDFEFRLDAREVSQLIEIPVSFLLNPSSLEHEEREVGGRRLRLPVFNYAGHRVWGATAIMLTELCRLLDTKAA